MKAEYIEVSFYNEEGYKPVVDYESWRVAVLNYCEELEINNLVSMQKHNESDEVFILLKGECTLFTGGIGDELHDIDGIKMVPLQLYNVKQGVWHTHTLEKDGTVLIVENRNTCDDNSPKLLLKKEEAYQLKEIYNKVQSI